MATIDDLNTSISSLNEQESIDLIMKIRSNRRKSKKKTISTKKKTAKKERVITINDLSESQRLKLISELEELM